MNATYPAPPSMRKRTKNCEPPVGKHRARYAGSITQGYQPLLALPLRQPSANVGAYVLIYSICQGTIRGVAFYAGEEPPIIARFWIAVITSLHTSCGNFNLIT